MKDFLHHLFIPRESNNHRPKILHHKSLLFTIAILLVGQLFLKTIETNFSNILGSATNISSEELLSFTNQKRQADGEAPLVLNNQLSEAAMLKARDMLEKNYWAHNAPEGTTPWIFIKKVGYDYIYAGENLARGFSSSGGIVDAWMASPSHRENMLSNNYQEVGFAILDGKLTGEDTVLVVEMFGGKGTAPLAKQVQAEQKPIAEVVPQTVTPVPEEKLVKAEPVQTKPYVAAVKANPLIDINSLSKNLSLFVILLFISVFTLDMIIIERRKIIRLVGHNIDHIFFFTAILILIIFVKNGLIL